MVLVFGFGYFLVWFYFLNFEIKFEIPVFAEVKKLPTAWLAFEDLTLFQHFLPLTKAVPIKTAEITAVAAFLRKFKF